MHAIERVGITRPLRWQYVENGAGQARRTAGAVHIVVEAEHREYAMPALCKLLGQRGRQLRFATARGARDANGDWVPRRLLYQIGGEILALPASHIHNKRRLWTVGVELVQRSTVADVGALQVELSASDQMQVQYVLGRLGCRNVEKLSTGSRQKLPNHWRTVCSALRR